MISAATSIQANSKQLLGARGLLLALALLSIPGLSRASYQVWCNNTQTADTDAASVFGETRPVGQTNPTRFHAGTDVSNSPCNVPGNSIQPIESGVVQVTGVPSCASHCVRIRSFNGLHAFDYIHLNVTTGLVDGSTVTAGSSILGKLQDLGGGAAHLHLNEIIKVGSTGYRVNPQRFNSLQFSDSDVPGFYSFTEGAVTNDIILVQDGTQTPFRFRSDSFFLKGNIDVMSSINDDGSQPRKGVYLVDSSQVAPGFSCNSLNNSPNVAFDTLHDSPSSTTADVQTMYFEQFTNSNGFYPTNWKINGNPTLETQTSSLNTDILPEGQRQVCVSAMGYPQGPVRSTSVNAVIDRTAPAITFKDTSGNTFTNATSSNVIVVQGNDSVSASGIYSIQLTGVSYSSTNYVSGVHATASNQFPDSSVLADGQYTATVCDLADNCASASFIIGRGQFLVENAA
jgi:hypothetical protein